MDLIEQWNQLNTHTSTTSGGDSGNTSAYHGDISGDLMPYDVEDSKHGQNTSILGGLGDEHSNFSVHPLTDWTPKREQGSIVSVDIGSNVLVIGTSKCHLVRWNVENDHFQEMTVGKREDDTVHKVFIDPLGVHVIVSCESGQNYYMHATMNKMKPLARFKNVVLECVAWDHDNEDEDTTNSILFGGVDGCIYEAMITDTKDKVFQKVYDLFEGRRASKPISGIQLERFPHTGESSDAKYFVMAATPVRYYQFIGGPTFDALFSRYTSNAQLVKFVELPGDLTYSELHFYRKYGTRATNCSWLTGAGIYYGSLVFGSQEAGDKVVDDGNLLGYPDEANTAPSSANAMEQPLCPASMALTQFHFILLYVDKLVVINKLSEEIVYSIHLTDLHYGDMIGLSCDPTTQSVWMFSQGHIFEIVVDNEDQGVWQLYLNEGKYEMALEYCKTDEERHQVYSKQADHLFALGSFELAAGHYANSQRSFEEIALKFVTAEARGALRVYLLQVLDSLKPTDSTQQVMIATWLTEIFLDKMNRMKDAANDGGDDDDGGGVDDTFYALQDEFREFLETYADCLNRNTTFDLISSHGRMDDLLYYAEVIGDLEWVIAYHIQHGNYDEALKPLAFHPHPGKIEDLYYKFAPVLMQHIPVDTVDMLLRMELLDPVKLMPALMRYEGDDDAAAADDDANQAIRYLEKCVRTCNDPAVHNYLVSLYAKHTDESRLLLFIESQNTTRPVYDYKFALRLCHQEGKMRACVSIYTVMELYEDAVKLALQIDLPLAKSIVKTASMSISPAERKKLWLMIARYFIERQRDIPNAMTILQECDGILKIEDLLPFFPNFVRIDEFKDEICDSLETYNDTITRLKDDMNEYTKSANLIRNDVQNLRNRSGFVTTTQKCDACMEQVLTRAFYLFPCTHVYHVSCIVQQVINYIKKNPRIVEDPSSSSLYGRIITDYVTEHPDSSIRAQSPEQWPDELIDTLASVECMFCGQMMIDMVHEPFIALPHEMELVKAWEI